MPLPPRWSRDAVTDLSSRQHGLITAAQLAELGVHRSTVSRQQLGGMFTRVLPGVHRVNGPGLMSADERDMAALLYAGPVSVLTGVSVLRRYGVKAAHRPALVSDRVHVLVPATRKRASHGFVTVERTVAMPAYREREALRTAVLPRAVLDAARRCTDEHTVRALLFEVVQRGLCDPASLDEERRRGQIRGSRFSRLALEEVVAGARSVPEGDLRLAFERRGVRGLLYNPRLLLPAGSFLACPDAYDPLTGVCLEVDSREHHFGVGDWEATMRRHGRMTAAGLAVLHSPPSRIATDVDAVVTEFLQACDVRRGWPPPRVVVAPQRRGGGVPVAGRGAGS